MAREGRAGKENGKGRDRTVRAIFYSIFRPVSSALTSFLRAHIMSEGMKIRRNETTRRMAISSKAFGPACSFCGEDLSDLACTMRLDEVAVCPGCGAQLVLTTNVTSVRQELIGLRLHVQAAEAGVNASSAFLITAWNPNEALGVAQVVDVTGLAPVTIREYCRGGLFPGAFRAGREWRIPRRDVFSFVQAHGHRRGRPYVRIGTIVRWNGRRWRVARRYWMEGEWVLDLRSLEGEGPVRKGVPVHAVSRA